MQFNMTNANVGFQLYNPKAFTNQSLDVVANAKQNTLTEIPSNSQTLPTNSPPTQRESSEGASTLEDILQGHKMTYNKIYNYQKINILYQKQVHNMTNAEIAHENKINYNTTRKIVCIYNKEQAQREKAS